MSELELKTPAKINFGLKVIEKRPDGYHNIETIFYPINLFDHLTFSISRSFSFISNNLILNNESTNSIIKAKEILELKTGGKFNFTVKLKKNIPIGAGMGGGSSDGAATLLALNTLFKLDLSINQLKELALNIGSDVPFFIHPEPYFASGRGEVLHPIDFKISFPILIVNPGIHVFTKWAYQNIKPVKHKISLLQLLKSSEVNFKQYKRTITNDFEKIVFKEFPAIEAIKNSLYKFGASFALLTGSGSTLFGIFPDFKSAKNAEEKFSNNYFTFLQH